MNAIQAKALAMLNIQSRKTREEADEALCDKMRSSLISEDEMEQITLSLSRRRDNVTTDELLEAINTIINHRYLALCSQLAGKGAVDVDIDMTAPEGHRVKYVWCRDLTEEENKSVERICREQQAKITKEG